MLIWSSSSKSSWSSVTNEASLTSLDAKGTTINWGTNGDNANWMALTYIGNSGAGGSRGGLVELVR